MKKATVLFMMMVLFCGCDTTRGNSGAEEWWGPRKWDGDSGRLLRNSCVIIPGG